MQYTREELVKAIADLMDGGDDWCEIQSMTGLDEERCKELEKIAKACIDEIF